MGELVGNDVLSNLNPDHHHFTVNWNGSGNPVSLPTSCGVANHVKDFGSNTLPEQQTTIMTFIGLTRNDNTDWHMHEVTWKPAFRIQSAIYDRSHYGFTPTFLFEVNCFRSWYISSKVCVTKGESDPARRMRFWCSIREWWLASIQGLTGILKP